MRLQKEILVVWRGDQSVDGRARLCVVVAARIAVCVTLLFFAFLLFTILATITLRHGKEPRVMAFRHNDCRDVDLGRLARRYFFESPVNCRNLDGFDTVVLTATDSITVVEDVLRQSVIF